MSTSTLRGQCLLTAVVVLVMIAASFGFNSMGVSAKPVLAYKTFTGTAQGPVGFAVSQPLSALAEKIQKPQIAPDMVSLDAPIREFIGGLQIPHQIVASNAFNLPGRRANRPAIEPDKKLFDAPSSPNVDTQWAGLSQGVNLAWYSYGVYPPDTQGDVGPSNYIQVVNVQMEIWDLTQVTPYTGTPLPLFVGPIDTLWKSGGPSVADCAVSEDGDPVVIYDEQADRWLVSQFALPASGNYECIAISQTGDPMGAWYLYQYSFPVMNDYPKFGVWHDGYYMSINQFNPSWAGQGVVVFDRATMLAGDIASMIYIDTSAACTTDSEPECNLGAMLPSDADGSTPPSGNQVFMQFDDDAWGYSGDQLQLWEMVPNWGLGTATFSHLVDLPTAAFDSEVCAGYSRNCIAQLGTTQKLDAISDRLMYRLQFRDFGSYKAMVVNHTVDVSGAGQAGIRWYELRNTSGSWSIYQQGDFAPDSKNRWMGSMALDDVGNIALGYSVSDATIYPGIRYTTHLASDPLGTMRTETTLMTGGGAQTGMDARWGDYSMMSVYPEGSGGCNFFYTQEYLRGTTPAEWYTWLGKFHNASCYSGDVISPATAINTNPTNPSYSRNAGFTFSGTDNTAVASFECSLDGATFAACTSTKNYTGLTLGAHTFDVRAIDISSNVDSSPAHYGWMVADNTPPDTAIDTNPTNPSNSPNANFTFSGTDDFAVASFECSLDGATYAACTSPKNYTGLVPGMHTLDVRAIDTSSNVDLSPAHYGWTIADNTAPNTAIDANPTDPYNSPNASFTFSGTDDFAVVSFECSLDGATFAACTSPKNYTGLALSAHTFDVQAIDTSSNMDLSPAHYDWTIADNTRPNTQIDSHPPDPSVGGVRFTFSGADDFAVARFMCSLDGAAYKACTSPKSYTGLLNGTHAFDVRAIDTSGNVDSSPAHFGWTVANPTVTSNFVSQAAYDGYVIESTETSGLGGAANATAATFSVGDYTADRQVKGFLSFNTAALPDGAVITGATLRMRYAGVVGTNPYGTHGALKVDIAKPFFGTAVGLLSNDFQFAASANNVAACGAAPVASWYSCNLTSFGFVNKAGTTQFRLGFTLTDNDDLGADLVQYFSGNSTTAAYRPVLVITYYVP